MRNVESFSTNGPVENGFPPKEDEECIDAGEVRLVAEQVVEDVVKRASRAANSKGCGLQKLPTIQIDSAPSPPNSPNEEEEPLDAEQVDINWEEDQEQEVLSDSENLRAFLKLYVEDLLLQAMVIAQKKLQFVGVAEEDESEEETLQTDSSLVPAPPTPDGSEKEVEEEEEEEDEDALIREAAEKVVEEVLTKATELVTERLEQLASLEFPDLPSFKIDTVKSAPPSPELEEEPPPNQKKWTFKMNQEEEKSLSMCVAEKVSWITFDEAPEDVRDAATRFIKEIVGKAVAMAEEKAVPTVPFNFEDVDLIKTSGPWYIRAREALVRVLRTACFCTPRRHDS
ncbi:nucleolin-like isoform X2 [Uloborus diversus]|uniref:nucleolin-like isoform X2 n=1 Tax=Uloborus diversus TaxID=327109 RepID=UPI002409D897|nr:nucleolin-like isoform X2 [Uloborus diversus]